MRRKIHPKDLASIELLYQRLMLFSQFRLFDEEPFKEYRLFTLYPKNSTSIAYEVLVHCSKDYDESIEIIPLENKQEIMLRVYNIILDALKFLEGNGSLDSFLGVTQLLIHNQLHIWIKIQTASKEISE